MSVTHFLLHRRVAGVRTLELACGIVLIALVMWVYGVKAQAGRERAEIAAAEADIRALNAEIRLLRAETAHLEQPGRIERLAAVYLGMEPVPAAREASVEQLPALRAPPPAPAPGAGA
ncbi:cell division protein [Brevundimonas sp. 2R-24]|uniref:Cell division protein n=1 Tax=Peiella sedimenti TaxID=3061083 RepID=A0ABT8SP65_9CAUL|nr:cell division protein [Caulobacteraceae bacterium XZ-24]